MAQQQNPQQNAAAETEQDINILKKITGSWQRPIHHYKV